MKSPKKLVYAFAVLIVPLLIYGCGGSDDDSGAGGNNTPLTGTETENINGIAVPPEPDETLNNSTIEGVDVNDNDIRDDVERFIAQQFGGDGIKHSRSISMAHANQLIIQSPSDGNINYYINMTYCLLNYQKLSIEDLKSIENKTFNTVSRVSSYTSNIAGKRSSGGVDSEYCGI